jgi:thymidine kinase
MLIFSHGTNTRDEGSIKSRARKDKYKSIVVKKSKSIEEKILKYLSENNDVNKTLYIIIDEIQFFDNELVYIIKKMIKHNIKFIVSGLDLDYKENTFGIMGDLLALSDEVIKLKGVCFKCGSQFANRTYIIGEGLNNLENDANIIVEGEDKSLIFEVRCSKCMKMT